MVRPICIVTNEEHRFLARQQFEGAGISLGATILEPEARNTAPALSLAAMHALESGEDPVLVVTPADQMIANPEGFLQAVSRAIKLASGDSITVLGVTPTHPETGFGYIKADIRGSSNTVDHLRVIRFVEKPNQADASIYLRDGNYFWNSGVFVLKASVWMRALGLFRPDISKAIEQAWATRIISGEILRPSKSEFEKTPSESIDYAVMEHCAQSELDVFMVPLEAGWSDLGSWEALWNETTKDSNGNALLGDVLSSDSRNTMVHASSRLVSLVGVENLVVVETADAVLVAQKSKSQAVTCIVRMLSDQNREECNLHRKVFRPWGWFDSVDEGLHFKVKRIHVNPYSSLSLQRHRLRAEHWVVVKGTAEVTCGEKIFVLSENQSTFIPTGEVHRLRNLGETPLEIIEVQSGAYLGEDDIERFDDEYGRNES